MLVTSCSNFLNIDNYFDDEFNIDSVFTNARYMEAYMWGAAAMFPDEAQTIRNGYTPGPMATDEGFNGLTGSGTSNIYHGMDFANGKITQDFLGDGSPNLNQWGKYYKIIRKCNSILQNLDRPKDLTNSERLRLEGYTRFIRAFAYYNLLVDYGPAILLGDEVVNTNEPIEYYDRPRATYDETMNYTCEEFEKAARLLPSPQDVSTLDFGRPTKGAALGLVARLRLIHASPLFNGGPVARKRCAGPAAGRLSCKRGRAAAAAGGLRTLILASAPFLWYSIGIYHIYKGAITMSEQEILSAVQDIFRDNFDDDSLEINRSTCADDIEDWDSLEQINLLTAIEKKFNIKFKLADVRGLKDVGDLLDLVARMV